MELVTGANGVQDGHRGMLGGGLLHDCLMEVDVERLAVGRDLGDAMLVEDVEPLLVKKLDPSTKLRVESSAGAD